MITGFKQPVKTNNGWQITIHKKDKNGCLWNQNIFFENESDALDWYKHLQQIQRDRQR